MKPQQVKYLQYLHDQIGRHPAGMLHLVYYDGRISEYYKIKSLEVYDALASHYPSFSGKVNNIFTKLTKNWINASLHPDVHWIMTIGYDDMIDVRNWKIIFRT